MVASEESKLIAGIDFQSGRVATVVARIGTSGIAIIGQGVAETEGIRHGTVVDHLKAVDAIRESMAKAMEAVEGPIDSVYAGISASMTKSFTSQFTIGVPNESEVSNADVRRVLQSIGRVLLPPDREILLILPQQFVVDDVAGISNPLGLVGNSLGLQARVVINSKSPRSTLAKCLEEAGLPRSFFVLSLLASSESVLSSEERENGVILLDFVDDAAELAIFLRGALYHTAYLPLPGGNARRQLAELLNGNIPCEDRVEEEPDCGMDRIPSIDDPLEIPTIMRSGRKARSRFESCTGRLFHRVEREVDRSDLGDQLQGGRVVLAGEFVGLPVIARLLERYLGVSVRIGSMMGTEAGADASREIASNPTCGRALGLVKWVAGHSDVISKMFDETVEVVKRERTVLEDDGSRA